MRAAFLRYCYGFECTMAYLAGNMGDTISMDNHTAAADKHWVAWWKEKMR